MFQVWFCRFFFFLLHIHYLHQFRCSSECIFCSFLSFSFCLIFFVVFYMCILSETRPITVTVKSRKSLQLGWTNVPNQLVNIGYCLRAALPLGSLLLSDCWNRSFVCVCICFCIMRFVVFHHIRSIWMHGMKCRERKKGDKKICGINRKVFSITETTVSRVHELSPHSGFIFNLKNTPVELEYIFYLKLKPQHECG